MWSRWGIGPVFAYESLLNARRWQVYAGRSIFVVVMLIGMTIVWFTKDRYNTIRVGGAAASPTYKQMAKVGELFFYALAGIQISLVMLAAPAAAAGSICMDRARGTLLHVLVTDLSDTEVVLGKLASRLAPVFGIIVCGVPVTCLATLLGGIEFQAIAGAFVISLSLAALACTLALTISLWASKPHEVLMAVYMILGFWLMAFPIWEGLATGGKVMGPPVWFQKSNPYVLVLAPYAKPGFASLADIAAFAGAAFAFCATLAVLVVFRLRKVVINQSGQPAKERRLRLPALKRFFPSWPSPDLDGDPVLWREWSRNRPSKLARRLWAALYLVIWASVVWGTYVAVQEGTDGSSDGFGFAFMMLFMFGLLMLSATAPTALADERVLGSLDVLLSTPLSTRSILAAKWWGMYRRVLLMVLVPLYASFFIAATVPNVPVYAIGMRFAKPAIPLVTADRFLASILCVFDFLISGALIVSWGLALATWVPRLGRAVALSVVVFFLTGLGWPLLVEFALSNSFVTPSTRWNDRIQLLREFLTALSPLVGEMAPIRVIEQIEFKSRWPLWLVMSTASLIKCGAAALLFWLTVKTFNRFLGRMPETGIHDRPRESAVREEFIPVATA